MQPRFEMVKHYQGRFPIDTEDLLTAVKVSLNHESDLYEGATLIVSWLNLSF